MTVSKEFLGWIQGVGRKTDRKRRKAVVIGVLGVQRGVGNTSMCMMLCNYLANVCKSKVAYIEHNLQPIVTDIAGQMEQGQEEQPLLYRGIAMYQNGESVRSTEFIEQDYEYIVLDLSWDAQGSMQEWLQSDARILIGALNRWKAKGWEYALDRLVSIRKLSFCCLSLCCDRQLLKNLQRRYGILIETIPYVADSFYLQPQQCKWLQSMLDKIQ